jgi:subtilase family serine protease
VSWGGAEGTGTNAPPDSNSSQMRLNTELMKLGVIGRAVFWAVGDAGSQGGCGKAVNGSKTSFACDNVTGFSPGFPATSPYVTTCGGTELSIASPSDPATAPPLCRQVHDGGCADGTSRTGSRGADERAPSIAVSAFSSGGGFSWWFDRPPWQQAEVLLHSLDRRHVSDAVRTRAYGWGRSLVPLLLR